MPEIDTSTPAVVLKLDPNVFHHGGLGVIRTLGRLGIPVYAVYEDRLAPASRSKYLRGGWVWRPGADHVGRLIDGLTQLSDQIGRRAVILPTDDAGALFLAEHGEPLRDRFLFPAVEPDLPRRLADKYSLYEVCRGVGVPAVATVLADTLDQADAFVAEHGLPVVAKLTNPWQAAAGLRSTTIVRDHDALVELYARAAGTQLMLQEYIGDGQDWIMHGYADARSVVRPAFTGRKLRSYPAHAGITSLGRAEPNDELADQVQKLVEAVAYRGIMDLDLRYDNRDGRYKLLDFNPRLGAQFRLFNDDAGVDVAVAAHLDLTGRMIPVGTPGMRRFLVENYDPLSALAYWRRGELSLRDWVSSLRGVDELAWFATDDLAPFGLMCARMCWRAVQRRFGGRPADSPAAPRYWPGRAHSQRKAALT